MENPEGIPDLVRRFFETRDLTTEEGKIDYLLDRIRKSDLTFVRNKVEYNGREATDFLRLKTNRLEHRNHIKIRTAQDFISQVASGSRMSGQPYAVVLKDRTRHNLQNVLQNELNALEFCLKQESAKTEVQPNGNTAVVSTSSQENDKTTEKQPKPTN